MRILVVDDDPKKVSVINNFLIEQGVEPDEIVIAEHAAAARRCLNDGRFDILLIDVLLPVRKDAVPKGENCIELLRQIVDDGTSPAPRYILGMTASLDARSVFDESFKSLVTQILHVAPGEDGWCESLSALLRLMKRNDAIVANDYDICILNALRSPELEAVYNTWPLHLSAERMVQRNILCHTGTVSIDGIDKRIACAHLSQMGPIASAHAATALIAEFNPRVLLMTGICGGFAEHVKIGDVVVAEKSWDWQAGKWSDEGTFATALDQRNASAELVTYAREIEATLPKLYESYLGKKPQAWPRLVVGPMVTGSSVVASLDIQKVFRNQHRKMVGIDMECYGLYYAAENHAGTSVRTICVKAVSDLADRAKDDDFQNYGSHLSALVALELVKRHFRN